MSTYIVTVEARVKLTYEAEDSARADAIEEAKSRAENGDQPEDIECVEILSVVAEKVV